jgi:hypothetical protein
VWGEAIRSAYHEAMEKDEVIERVREEFDPFKYFLSMAGLLNHLDKELEAVYNIFAWSEQLIYNLRRYDDDFLSKYINLSKTISDIQGECFKVFIEDDAFAKAYFLNRILSYVYGAYYIPEKRDVVTQWLFAENMHHDLSRPMSVNGESLKWVIDIHQEISRAADEDKLTNQMRLMVALKIAGRRFHYEHHHEGLIAMLGGEEFDIPAIREELKRCIVAHEEYGKASTKRFRQQESKEYEL